MTNLSVVLLLLVVILLGTVLMILIKMMQRNDSRKNTSVEIKVAAIKMLLPLKMQACERFILFLERIQVQVLVKRIFVPGMTKDGFHLALLQNIGDEFEHNLAQQLYVKSATWKSVEVAKEELIRQINTTFDKMQEEQDPSIIAQALVALPNPSVQAAISIVRQEFEKIL